MKRRIEVQSPGEKQVVYLCTDFSTNEIVAGDRHAVMVYSIETQLRLKRLKGHKKNVTAVMFSSDASKVISGSIDCSVIVWDWQYSESLLVILRGHKGMVTSLCMSDNEARLFSGSSDRTVKMGDMNTDQQCRTFAYDAKVESVAACPKNEIVAVGTRNGRLQCVSWVSQEPVSGTTYLTVVQPPRSSLEWIERFSSAVVLEVR